MNTKLFAIRIMSLLHIPARIILAVAFLLGSLHVIPITPVTAAAGSTRVMCEYDPSLVGCWRMEEGGGTTLQDGGALHFNDGTIINNPSWVSGKIGARSLLFNASSSQYITIPNDDSLNPTSMTVAAWIKPSAAGTQDIVKKLTVSAGFEFSLSATAAGQNVFFRLNNDSSGRINSVMVYPTDGTWIHAAATYDGTTLRMYINGIPNGTPVPYTTGINLGNSNSLTIGGIATRYFTGGLDDVRVYSRALSASEIAVLASSTPPGDVTTPATPTNIIPTAGDSKVGLTWTAPADPDVAGYNIYTSTSTPVDTTTPENGTLITTESYTVTGLTNGQLYYFILKAVDTSGNASPVSSEVSASPIGDTTPPTAPTGLSAMASNTTVSLSWAANTETDLAGYNIYRSTTPGVPLTSPINGGTLVSGTTYTDTGRANGQIYYYVITAVDTGGNQSGASNEVNATPIAGNYALQFDGTNDYVTFGSAAGLGVTNFTLETWFYWTGGGTTMTTSSTQGLPSVYPLVSKGRGEADGDNRDTNYFLGIDSATKALAVDFEDTATGMNYPFVGTTPVTINTWHHAAVTYDSVNGVYTLYLDGTVAGTKDIGNNILPRADSIQHAGIATAMTSAGTPSGYFQGMIDEARIWNVVRTQEQIRADINSQLYSGTGLIARWGMGEGAGTTIASSVGTFPGMLTNGPVWVTPGAPFDIFFDAIPPEAPTGLSATAAIGQILLEWTPNTESDLGGYNVYRGTTSPVVLSPGSKVNSGLVLTSAYTDNGVVAGITYHYAVTAVDISGNESSLSAEDDAIPLPPEAIDLGSNNAYINLGDVADLSVFTLETWLRRDGAGVAETTGGGGVDLIPLITNGTSEAENAAADINYFLGLRASDGVLCADFEEDAAGSNDTGLNHPVCGVTPLVSGTWYHAAATYDGSTWKLYLNGNLDATLLVGEPVNAANTSPLAFGTSIRSNGTTLQGFFDGALDEVRIWSVARSQAEIISTINNKLTGAQANLAGRWGFDDTEVAGTSVYDTSGNSYTGVVTGTGYTWIAGAPFNLDFNLPPAAPVNPAPAHGATGIGDTATLSVTVTDPENDEMAVSFYGRALDGSAGEDFTLIAIPDPQYYASTYPAIYNAQMDWVVANKTSRNIPFVVSLGDNVDSDNSTQWSVATTAWDKLTSGGVRYGLALGNHDGAPSSTTNFNSYFASRLANAPNSCTNLGSDFDNTYCTFSVSGMDFVVIFIEHGNSSTEVLNWANGVISGDPDRRAIVVTHDLLTGNSFTTQGNAIYQALRGNANLFLMLGGHADTTGQRTDTYNGNTVYSLRSDYQFVDSQQSGYLRMMRFSPVNDAIYISTYSPNQNQYLTDSLNQFSLAYVMEGGAPFTLIGTAEHVPSGETASISWTGLSPDTEYEWYAIANDSKAQTSSDTWSFNTGTPVNSAPMITEGESTSVSLSKNGTPTPFSLTLHATDANAGDTLTWSVLTPAAHGTAAASGTGTSAVIGYTPDTNYVGADSFEVQVSDGNGGTDSISVNVTITAVTGLVCSVLDSKLMTASTGEKPQSKVWNYAGNWYAVFPTSAAGASSAGTWLWRLQGTAWTEVIKLSDNTAVKADVKVAGNVAHALLYNGASTQLVSIEYSGGTYQLWSARTTPTDISLPSSEIATIDIDSTGRMWLATRQDTPTPAKIVVYYSDSPYSSFQGPVELASGVVGGDDISVVTAMPGNKIGVLWSNQNTKRFGFRVHNDGDDPAVWSADELPASQSAIDSVGSGMADDHLNIKVASDGTLYAAVKTGYDTSGYPKMALLVRRPNGTWDNLYGIDESGTRAIIELDEVHGVLTYIYTQSEGNNPIVYRQSSTSSIAFDARKTLRAESFNDVSSMKTNYNNELVVIYSNASVVSGQICSSGMDTSADLAITKTDGVSAVERGDALTYTLVAANLGPQAVPSARVVDDLPAELTNVSWTCSGANGGSCASSGTGDIDTQVSLPAGASVTFIVTAVVAGNALADISNTASIIGPVDIPDPVPGNNTATDVNSLIGIPSVCESDPTLVGCWQMEENGGPTFVDGSSYENDAAVTGSPAWAAGKRGTYSIDLSGTTQYGSVSDDPSLDLTSAITLAAWIRPERYATQDLVKKATNSAVNGYELSLATTKTDSSSQRPFFRINQVTSGDTYRINAATMYPIDGSWMHVAATYDGTTMRLYINGVLESSLAATAIATNDLPLSIGAQSESSRGFMGGMDDVRVYNRALTSQEIQVLAGLAPNAAPVFTQPDPQAVTMSRNGTPYPFSLTLDATDADGDTLTWSILTPASHGTAAVSGTGYSKEIGYTPDADYVGTDSFVVRVSDGRLGAATLTMNVTVEVSYISVTGTVSMQGRVTRAGVPVTLTGTTFGPYTTTSIEQLSNNLVFAEVVPGEYAITTNQPRYLNLKMSVTPGDGGLTASKIVILSASRLVLMNLELVAGNAMWSDNVINIFDAVVVGTTFGTNGEGDVNFDGRVNIQDLALVGGNYRRSSASAYLNWEP